VYAQVVRDFKAKENENEFRIEQKAKEDDIHKV